IIERLRVEIQQRKPCLVGKVPFLQKSLHLPGRSATQAKNPRYAASPDGCRRAFDNSVGQVLDAIAMRFGWRLVEKPDVDKFGEKGGPFKRRTNDHVNHLIIAGITERFMKRAI